MRRRSKVSGASAKKRRSQAAKANRRNAPKAAPRFQSVSSGKETEVAGLTHELKEALQRESATFDVLQVISKSSGDFERVLSTMLRTAVQICGAKFGNIYRWDGATFHLLATCNTPPAFAEERRRAPVRPHNPKGIFARLVATKSTIHFHDAAAEEQRAIERGLPEYETGIALGSIRTLLAVPLLKNEELIGAFTLVRQEVRPFTDRQVALVTNFAAQAVIAIENARLLNELRQSLEQQTAAAEILRIISTSPSDLDPVFRMMLRNATRLCEADFGQLLLHQGDGHFLNVAMHNAPPAFVELRKREPMVRASGALARIATECLEFLHVADSTEDASYKRGDADFVQFVDLCEVRTFLAAPLRKGEELIGVIGIYRKEVRPFTEKQIALLRGFAAQAVIAIENARLLKELRQSLEQQTATAQVLQVISRSTGALAHVFSTILENATRICEAKFGTLYLREDDGFRAAATHNAPPAYKEARAQIVHPSPYTNLWRAANTKRAVQIADATKEEGYLKGEPFVVSAVTKGGFRSVLSVPMLHEDQVVGVITIFRQEVSSFGDEHVSLLENFAAQAVIAIENTRLLNNLRDRTQQLQAQSEELAKLNEHLEQRVTDQVGEIERMGRLRRFLPPQVADLIVASGTEKQLESHRREITALFCDLRGFTGFSESADPEDVSALLREYHAAIGEKIIKYSGTLERYAGDGVMVVFNDPVPVENPPLQAVLMALEMRDAIGALTETWRRWGHDIGFGIGIAHGFATLGTIGFEGRFDYAAIGTVSNVASRLCDEAKPGQILISPRVLTKVEYAVKVEPVGEFELKGIRRPLAAYNVLSEIV
jgi:GAF domain-containing protein